MPRSKQNLINWIATLHLNYLIYVNKFLISSVSLQNRLANGVGVFEFFRAKCLIMSLNVKKTIATSFTNLLPYLGDCPEFLSKLK